MFSFTHRDGHELETDVVLEFIFEWLLCNTANKRVFSQDCADYVLFVRADHSYVVRKHDYRRVLYVTFMHNDDPETIIEEYECTRKFFSHWDCVEKTLMKSVR